MSIDYTKVEGFKELDQKEGKIALAEYAQDNFDVKLVRNKTFENMLADLEVALKEKYKDLPTDEQLAAEPEIDFTPPAGPPGVDLESLADNTKPSELVLEPMPEGHPGWEMQEMKPPTGEVFSLNVVKASEPDPEEKIDELPVESGVPVLAPESDSAPVSADMAWMEGFAPTISLMGRNERTNGYYTCPWWIYDWIAKNPDSWFTNPDACPHQSAISVIKSLAWFAKRDGEVRIRETRNSRFVTLKI